jgi:purine-binding chemotaxis protein CheW
VQTHHLCTFSVDGQLYGVDVMDVQEVIRRHEITRVPLAPRIVRGLINLRGQIVTAVDLRRRLELPERPADDLARNVVLRTADGVVSLLVDDVGDVVDVDAASFEPPPVTLRGVAGDVIRGAYKLKDRLLLVLDTERVTACAGEGARCP